MKIQRSVTTILTALFINSILLVTTDANAVDTRGLSVPGLKPQVQIKGPAPGQAPGGNLRIKGSTISAILKDNPKPLPSTEEVNSALDRYKVTYRRYFDHRKRTWESADNCRSRSWTPQEQRTAGCRSADTVAACEEKLFNHCMRSGRNRSWATRNNQTRNDFNRASSKAKRLMDNIISTTRGR